MTRTMNTTMRKAQNRVTQEARKRRARMLELHRGGLTYEEIGQRLGGISRQRVGTLVKQAEKEAAR